jgi:hypothetical protein
MALTTHIGGGESDSFVTVEEADGIVDSLFTDASFWEDLSETQKELRLQLGAQLLGHFPLRGRPVFRNQRLCFPRDCVPYGQRFSIPADVKKAQVWLAADAVHRALSSLPDAEAGLPSLYGRPSQISLGGLLSVSFSGDSTAGGSLVERIAASLPFTIQMQMKKYMAQIRGGSVGEERTLSTTTTVLVTPTTTTTI